MSTVQIAIASVSSKTLLDNRVLGLKGGEILAAIYGGKTTGGGNKPIIYYKPDGTKCSIGTGDIRMAFISSSCKGTGRGGKALKVPDAKKFLHLSLTANGIRVVEYNKDQIS